MRDPIQTEPRAADTGGVGLSASSFADVYVAHMPELTRYCRSILRDREDAEDAAQNAMERALRALADGSPEPERMRPWLFTIAQREAINLLRRRGRAVELDESSLGPQGSAEELAAVRERLAELLADVRELSPRQREVLVARELGGRSFKQIARSIGTTEAAAQQLVLEARQSLRAFEAGRSLECGDVRAWISAHDHARIRTRRVRAHLRACTGCRAFGHAIAARRRDFALLLPGLGGGSLGWSSLAALLGGGKLAAAGAVAVTGTALITLAPLTAGHPDPREPAGVARNAARSPAFAPVLVATSTRLGIRARTAQRAGSAVSGRPRGSTERPARARTRRPQTGAPAPAPAGPANSVPGGGAPAERPKPTATATPPAPAAGAPGPPAAERPVTPPVLDPAVQPVLDTVGPVLDGVTGTVDGVAEKLPKLPDPGGPLP